MTGFGALPGSISLLAAGSGGAIIDCAAISGVAGEGFAGSGLRCRLWPSRPLPIRPSPFRLCRFRFGHLRLCRFQPGALRFGGVGLRGILGGGVNRRRGGLRGGGCGFVGGGGGAVATGATAGEAAGLGGLRFRSGGGEAGAEPCRAMAPVTESSPCSRPVTREYSRSRSLLSVSMAAASRRASFWVSLATDWICCACRVRSAAAT